MPSEDTQFKPGQSGNPAGRTPMPEEVKKLRKLNRTAFEIMLDELMYMSVEQLNAISKDPKTPIVKMAMAAILAKSIQHGDYRRFGYLLEQMIGKAIVRLEATGLEGTPLFAASRTPEERAIRMKEIHEALAKIKGAEQDAREFTGRDPGPSKDPGTT